MGPTGPVDTRAGADAVVRADVHAGERIPRRTHLYRPRSGIRQRPDRERHLLRDRRVGAAVGRRARPYMAAVGVHRRHGVASYIKSGRAERRAARLALDHGHLRPLSSGSSDSCPDTVAQLRDRADLFLAAMQIGLFRGIGDLAYLPVATTGNLMRFLESGYEAVVEKHAEARRARGVYGALIVAFAIGALSRRSASGPGACMRSGCPQPSLPSRFACSCRGARGMR